MDIAAFIAPILNGIGSAMDGISSSVVAAFTPKQIASDETTEAREMILELQAKRNQNITIVLVVFFLTVVIGLYLFKQKK